jgi:hypothetical protein
LIPPNATGRRDLMAKTTWSVTTHYEGERDLQDIFVDMIADKIRRDEVKITVDNYVERGYNHEVSCNEPPRLAG